jgi:fibronectin type 3 domain-containing protein
MKRNTIGSTRLRNRGGLHYLLFSVSIFTFTLTPAIAFSGTLTLAWDPNLEPDVAGYKVYYGTQSRDYIHVVDIGHQTSCTISGLTSGEVYYFAVTAYDINNNESAFSVEITYEVPNSAYQKSMPWIPLLLLND